MKRRISYLSNYVDVYSLTNESCARMFRNVTGAQEAVVHWQSDESLPDENHATKVVQDIQSDDISQTYATLKSKWLDRRERLTANMKALEQRHASPHEVQRIRTLISCLNELIDHGELSRNCQVSLDSMDDDIQPGPETYQLPKKPLGDRMIRLPRHVSKTALNESEGLKKTPSEMVHLQRSRHRVTSDRSTANTSRERIKTGIQFYVVAEPFRNAPTDSEKRRKPRRKHYASSMIE